MCFTKKSFLGINVVIFFLTFNFYFNNYYDPFYREPQIDDPWIAEQERRITRLKTVCDTLPNNIKGPHNGRQPFIFVKQNNFLLCRTHKCGSTTWAEGSLIKIMGVEYTGMKNYKSNVKSIDDFRRIEKNKPLAMILTRHPFERLVSAFINKAPGVDGKMTFLEHLENMVIGQYNRAHCTSDSSNPCDEINHHWRPIYNSCFPCYINWTVISKMETFAEDRWRAHEMLGWGKLNQEGGRTRWNIAGGDKTTKLTREWFQNVPETIKEKLRSIYKFDFELFDYDPQLY